LSLAIFDLDNTLLGGDSDYLWGQFLVEKGIVDSQLYEKENQRFYDEYKLGKLDIYEFLRFSLKPLKEHDIKQLETWREEFIAEKINTIVLPKAHELVDSHRERGHTLMIITATNSFVTQPIADLYGIEFLLATEPQMESGQYTGEVSGIPCFQEGKVTNLNTWLKNNNRDLKGSYFYSDSHNDLPLLKLVDNPVAVDADEILVKAANENAWPLLSLR